MMTVVELAKGFKVKLKKGIEPGLMYINVVMIFFM